MATEEETFQQRHGDMENEEMAPVFEAEEQLEAHSGKDFHWNIKIKHMQRVFDIENANKTGMQKIPLSYSYPI